MEALLVIALIVAAFVVVHWIIEWTAVRDWRAAQREDRQSPMWQNPRKPPPRQRPQRPAEPEQ